MQEKYYRESNRMSDKPITEQIDNLNEERVKMLLKALLVMEVVADFQMQHGIDFVNSL